MISKIAILSATLSLLPWLGSSLSGQETAASPAPTETVAKTPPTIETVTTEDRLTSLESYFQNLAPSKGPLPGNPGPGHNGFIMICAALVLFMTLPGLALFYGGLVRKKNVLSVLAQCLGCAGLVTILWWAVGFSFVFGEHSTEGAPWWAPYLGSTKYFFLEGVTSAPNGAYSAWVSFNVFSMYQLMFAIITPALIIGAIAERMKFTALMTFLALWMLIVYFPLAHMVWGANGFLNGVWNAAAGVPSIDFAGGTVVHMSSGWSALALCLILGKRNGFGSEKMAPHSMVLCMIGTGMLWVGWYGFNAGSAVAADGIAANAFTTTTLAAAVACFTWALAEKLIHGRASVLGFCSGAVSGLVVITPACGFVSPTSAVLLGVLAGLIPFFCVLYLKRWFGYDDALDTFGVHGVGGTLGAIVSGFTASAAMNSNLAGPPAQTNGLATMLQNGTLYWPQIQAALLTIAIAVVATVAIAYLVKITIGLRPTPEQENQGLDIAEHGEEGYIG